MLAHRRCRDRGWWACQEPWPEGGETLVGLFMTCVGEVDRDRGGFEWCMPQGAREETGMHAGFASMGGVRMPEGRDGHAQCGHAGTVCGGTAGALDTGPTPGGGRWRTVLVIPPGGGKEPGLVTMGFPVGAE